MILTEQSRIFDICTSKSKKCLFQSLVYTYSIHSKPDSYSVDDISGTKARWIHRSLRNKPDRTLNHDDIEGSKPKPKDFRTSRQVDPLEPKYNLPSFKAPPAETPKFIRDTLNIDDISGTKPLKPFTKQVNITHHKAYIYFLS